MIHKFDRKIKTITIDKTTTRKYYGSILVEVNQIKVTQSMIEADKTIGIDLSWNHLLICLDTQKNENATYLHEAQRGLANH